ncbi:MAG: AI-2E family transporter [Halomonadaceae bacterium]|nr:MAG: AI-2E family transporter [Halomonadaceae bacterium]
MSIKMEQRAFLLLLVLVSVLFLWLLQPFFGPIFWACAIAIIFHPLQSLLTRLWGPRRNLTALVTLLVCLIIVIIPTLFVVASFIHEGLQLYRGIQSGDIDPEGFLTRISETVPLVGTLMANLGINTGNLMEQALDSLMQGSQLLAQHALNIGQNTFRFFLNIALMLYLAFFLLRDGDKLQLLISQALPLGREREALLLQKFAEVTRATVKGNILIAAIQGALGGLIFWALGLPGALLWAVVMAVLSLIPAVGASLIWGPAALYLIAVGDWIQGVVLIVFGVAVIGLIDNVLRPILVGRDTKLPDYVVLLSTLGGLWLLGINGFVVGPLIAALFMAVWGIFIRDFNQHKSP